MYSRPTTTQLNLSRRFTFVSDSYYSFTSYISRNALKLQALSPHVHSRPTPIGQTCRDVSVCFFLFLSLHLQECLEAPGPVTACAFQTNLNRPNLSRRLFLCFTSTNFPSNFFRYSYQKLLCSHTLHSSAFTGNLYRHCTYRLSHIIQAQFTPKTPRPEQNVHSLETVLLRYQETKLVKTKPQHKLNTDPCAKDQGAQYNDSKLHLSRRP